MSELVVLEDKAEFPMTFTQIAKEKLAEALKGEPEGTFVRVGLKGGGCAGFLQELTFDTRFDPEDDIEASIVVLNDQHTVLGSEPYTMVEATQQQIWVVCDYASAAYLKGTVLDYVMEKFKEGFKFNSPQGAISKTCGCGASVTY